MDGVIGCLQGAVRNNHLVILTGLCSVEYDGRAESYLPEGERVILIKSDNSLQIHQPTGNTPVNYMKEGATHSFYEEGGNLVIRSSLEKERLLITVLKVHDLITRKLQDGQGIQLQGNEKDMSDYIYANPDVIEDGFKPLSREEHTKYGFIDVFGNDRDGNLVVVECKRFKADPSAATQLRRYVEKIKKSKGVSKVRGVLVAPKISKNGLVMLTDWGFSFKKFDPPHYLIQHKKNQAQLDLFL
ncbi:endonuclease NucS [Candidatus Woesearchaeota archaeon]|nr:endonuclease NucS [Candidatus Woesearchaeota archaeon]